MSNATPAKKRAIPTMYTDIDELNEKRGLSLQHLSANNHPRKNLDESLNNMHEFQRVMSQLNIPKQPKKVKVGQKGMNDLIKVVAGLKQDIKRINDAQSVKSAQDWIKRNKYTGVLEATHKDVDGDELPEVVVQTIDGTPVIVNGYTTAPSLFPYRRMYYTDYPTPKARSKARANGIRGPRDIINNKYNVQYDQYGREIVGWNKELAKGIEKHVTDSGYTRLIKPHNRTTYQAFVARVITPIYKAMQYCLDRKRLGFSLTTIASAIWNNFALIPAMQHVYGEEVTDPNKITDKEWKILRSKKVVKRAIEAIVLPFLTNAQNTIEFIVPICVNMLHTEYEYIDKEHVPAFQAVAAAFLYGLESHLPEPASPPDEFVRWGKEQLPVLISASAQRVQDESAQDIQSQIPGYYNNNDFLEEDDNDGGDE